MAKVGDTNAQAKPEALTVAGPQKAATVRMELLTEGGAGPREADVHPDEVKNWQKHGWHIKE